MAPRSGHISNSILRAVDQSMMVAAVGVSILWNYAPEGGLQSAAFAAEFLSARVKVSNIALGTLVLIFWHLSFSVQGLYRSHRLISVREEFTEVARAVVVSTAALLFIGQLGHWQTINARTAVCTVLLGVVLTGGARALLR